MLLLPTATTRKPCMTAPVHDVSDTLRVTTSPTAALAGIRERDNLGVKPVLVLGRDSRASNAARDARYRTPWPRAPASSFRWKLSSSAGRDTVAAAPSGRTARLARKGLVAGVRLVAGGVLIPLAWSVAYSAEAPSVDALYATTV